MEDPATIEYLGRIGVGPSWRCLEVGAGCGSIARWLSDRVGTGGHVVATDIHLSFLSVPESPQLEVRRHDITSDELETGAFDLVHARNLLTHVPRRVSALKKLGLDESDFIDGGLLECGLGTITWATVLGSTKT